MPLEEYRRKRSFPGTPEPSGSEPARGEGNSFVVQKHDATRLHYDLRLELNGVLLSWAVPKGPPLAPDDHRLAVQTVDITASVRLGRNALAVVLADGAGLELLEAAAVRPDPAALTVVLAGSLT